MVLSRDLDTTAASLDVFALGDVRGGAATAVHVAGGGRVQARHAVLADVHAPALYRDLLCVSPRVLEDLERFQLDWATVKVDWALDRPIPWTAASARRAGVIHVADGVDELTLGAAQIATGMVPASPFLVVGQYAPVDETRSPRGTDVAWAYTQVPATVRGDAAGEGVAGARRDGDGGGERLLPGSSSGSKPSRRASAP